MLQITEYQQSIIIDALSKIKAARESLLSIDHNFAFVDCCELQFDTVNSCGLLLDAVYKSLSNMELKK